MEDTVTISREEYEQLLADSDKLACLEGAGVDNQSGYGDAMEMLEVIFMQLIQVLFVQILPDKLIVLFIQ